MACLGSKIGNEKPVCTAAAGLIAALAFGLIAAAADEPNGDPASVSILTILPISASRGSALSSESTSESRLSPSKNCSKLRLRASPAPPANWSRCPALIRSTLMDELMPWPRSAALTMAPRSLVASAMSEVPSIFARSANVTFFPDNSEMIGTSEFKASRISRTGFSVLFTKPNTGVRIWLTAAPMSIRRFSK